jgi:membrane-associated phospholipid phosphatase
MFLWRRVRPRVRPLLALYPLAMGLTLIATGEHYFFDVLVGWLYAAAAMAAWAWWERRASGVYRPDGWLSRLTDPIRRIG